MTIRIARLSIFAALNGDKSNGRSYNITEERPSSYEVRWPRFCALFGLVGVPPLQHESSSSSTAMPQEQQQSKQQKKADSTYTPNAHPGRSQKNPLFEWVIAHADAWAELEKEHNLRPSSKSGVLLESAGWDFMRASLLLPYDGVYDNTSRMEQLGFAEEVDIYDEVERAWRDFARFGDIPPL